MFRIKQLHANEAPFRLLLDTSDGNSETVRGFVAISYCWHSKNTWQPVPGCELGDSEYHKPLPVSDLSFKKAVELKNHDEGIWIDQLCINQANEKEKAIAIASMDLVYKYARLVVILLEDIELGENETSVIEALQRFYKRSTKDSFPVLSTTQKRTLWNAICKIGDSRWFQRAWCCHEFHLCRDAVFVIPCHGGPPISVQLDILERALAFKGGWIPTSMELQQKELEGYDRLVLLLTSRYLFSHQHISGPPVVGICYLVSTRQASQRCDKVSIVSNILGLGLSFHGNVNSEQHCRYIFTLLALVVGDSLALCYSGDPLNNGNGEWAKTTLDLSCLQWSKRSDLVHLNNRYPKATRELCNGITFNCGRMKLDLFIIRKVDSQPTSTNLERARTFLRVFFDEDFDKLARMEPEEWARPVFDREMFIESGAVYFALALDLGLDWMSKALSSMRCSPTPQGLRADGWVAIRDSLWQSAKKHLLPSNDLDENLKKLVGDFLTFSLQHILLLGETAQNVSIVTSSSSEVPVWRAMISLPPGCRAHEHVLSVPVWLLGPGYVFNKRLWLLRRQVNGQNPLGEYSIRAKGYMWGDETPITLEGSIRREILHS